MAAMEDDRGLVVPEIHGRLVHLRVFRTEDSAAVREAAGDPLIPHLTTVPTTDDPELVAAYLHRQHERARTRVGYSFAIADHGDVAVGQIGLWLRDLDQGRASIGYWIRPSARRHGYATDALTALAGWAWSLADVHRLQLYVEPWNEASWRAAEHAGFIREGLLRSWQEVAGQRRDMLMYASIRDPGSA
jgi:RimJ/RimL family protein N-acetyltransferase